MEHRRPAETFTFDYDAADRLLEGASLKNTSTGAVLADHRFIYDPIDNRVSIREGGKLRSGTFNNANQLTAETGGGKVRITGSVNKAGASVTVAGKAAAVHPKGGFAVEVDATEGANHLPLVVTEADGTVTTKYVDLVFDQAEPLLYTYDANGNLETVAPAATPTLPNAILRVGRGGPAWWRWCVMSAPRIRGGRSSSTTAKARGWGKRSS